MPTEIKLFADFHNADKQGRVRLNTTGTFEDLAKYNIILRPGLEVLLNDDDSLEANGVVEYSEDEKIWVARIDWNKISET